MHRHHWDYYLTLLEDLSRLSRFIEFSEKNAEAYSIELVRLLLAIGSEIDVVCKILCEANPNLRKAKNIDDYREQLLPSFPAIPSIEVTLPRHKLSFTPWKAWNQGTNPEWWRAYNDVKHQRDIFFHSATLWNVLESASGLCVIVAYLNREWLETETIQRPLLFLSNTYKGPPIIMSRARIKMP